MRPEMWKCPHCHTKTRSVDFLLAHIKREHPNAPRKKK